MLAETTSSVSSVTTLEIARNRGAMSAKGSIALAESRRHTYRGISHWHQPALRRVGLERLGEGGMQL